MMWYGAYAGSYPLVSGNNGKAGLYTGLKRLMGLGNGVKKISASGGWGVWGVLEFESAASPRGEWPRK